MGRDPVESKLFGFDVGARPLPFPLSQELLPDATRFFTRAVRVVASALQNGKLDFKGKKLNQLKMEDFSLSDLQKMMLSLDPNEIGDLMEMLTKHHRKLLSTTWVVMPNEKGELERKELGNDGDRSDVLEAHPELFIGLCLMAGRTNFARFFPANALRDGKIPIG